MGFFGTFLAAWAVMVLLGILHSMTGWACNIGYWPTWIIMLILWVVAVIFGRD